MLVLRIFRVRFISMARKLVSTIGGAGHGKCQRDAGAFCSVALALKDVGRILTLDLLVSAALLPVSNKVCSLG